MSLSVRKYLATEPGLRWVLIVAAIFAVISLGLGLNRYYSYYSSYDQGIFNQVFWNNWHGRWFESTLSSALSTNVVHDGQVPDVTYRRLGQHFTPALLLWWPIYALFPSPVTLTVLMVSFITLAGLVLYVLARQYLPSGLAAQISLSFYGANAVVGPSWANFHDISQIPLFVLSLLLALERRWWGLFWVLVPIILVVREDSGITLFGVGLYMLLSRRFPVAGLLVCGISFFYILLLTNLVMPIFSADVSRRFMLERFGQYVDGTEASTIDVLFGMARRPWLLVWELINPIGRTINYLLGQWLPLAFIPAIAPSAWLVAGPPLFKLLIGKGQTVLSINVRYALSVVPGLFYGVILWWSSRTHLWQEPWRKVVANGLREQNAPWARVTGWQAISVKMGDWLARRKQWGKQPFKRFWAVCIALSLFFTVISNPNRTLFFAVPDSYFPFLLEPLPAAWSHARSINQLLAEIPADASVAATTYIVPHVSGRREVVRFPLIEIRNDDREVIQVDYAIADFRQLELYYGKFGKFTLQKGIVNRIDQSLKNQTYGITGFQDQVIRLTKGANNDSEALNAWQAYRDELVKRFPVT
ncbi:MAG: DUF2079 domain-containing protein [Cyanobacteria bacterium P01_H01_bin.15]